MSNMFDYNNVESLCLQATKWGVLDKASTDYAIKFVFGEIDAARRMSSRSKSNSENKQKQYDYRLRMLKMLAATIVDYRNQQTPPESGE